MTRKEEREFNYFAGLIDGEGHICYYLGKNGRGELHPDIKIIFVQSKNNEGLKVCEWIKERYGGNITGGKRDFYKMRKVLNGDLGSDLEASNREENPMYRWELRGEKASFLCIRLLKYSIVKQKQIRYALQQYSDYKSSLAKTSHKSICGLSKRKTGIYTSQNTYSTALNVYYKTNRI
jgi:predicted ATPase